MNFVWLLAQLHAFLLSLAKIAFSIDFYQLSRKIQ
jgi:hypothetical protein